LPVELLILLQAVAQLDQRIAELAGECRVRIAGRPQ